MNIPDKESWEKFLSAVIVEGIDKPKRKLKFTESQQLIVKRLPDCQWPHQWLGGSRNQANLPHRANRILNMADWIGFKDTKSLSKDYFIKKDKVDGVCQVDEGVTFQCEVLIAGKWIRVDGKYEDLKQVLMS